MQRLLPIPRRGVWSLAWLALAIPLGPTLANAQSSSGSESGIVLASDAVGLAGRSVNGSNDSSSATLGQVATGPVATSESFIVQAGVAWTPPELTGDAPIVFGTRPATGDLDGGEVVEVYGYNFLAPGAGALAVDFGTQPGVGPLVVSNTVATVTSPGELTALGNPPPEAVVRVTNLLGSDRAKPDVFTPGYLYEPALTLSEIPRVGRRSHMHVFAEPGTALILALGQTLPGLSLTVPPLEGAVEVVVNPQLAVSFDLMPTGAYQHLIDVPADPALAGMSLSYQGLAIVDLPTLTGAFTNPLTLIIQP